MIPITNARLISRAFVIDAQRGGISTAKSKIDRTEKNRMRKNLEEIVLLQKELEARVDNFLKDESIEDYQLFWEELKKQQNQNIQRVTSYMTRKCNR
jgi:hypothetical protein